MTDQERNIIFERWFETKPEQKNWYPNPNVDAQWTAFEAGWFASRAAMRPMTGDELFDALKSCDEGTVRLPPGFVEFARAVEAHHGVGAARPKATPEPAGAEDMKVYDAIAARHNAARPGEKT
jgi:hypothetical protein